MKKFLISGAIIAGLFVYFFMTLVIFPQEFLSMGIIEPQPIHLVSQSADQITLGDSFEIEIQVTNQNDIADILITSVGFPGLTEIGDIISIKTYDYTQSPRFISPGEKLSSQYTAGEIINAHYPSIEAYSRNVAVDANYRMVITVMPQSEGTFETFIKTIAIPHTTELSHYPYEGMQDAQSEYVSVLSVEVNP